ncbi:MAG: hypothetical protein N2043_02085 [Ignavibacterium sp.]|nr:hypothetical protein [Ignavibacterium sp.]
MFKETKPHKKEIIEGQPKIRYGSSAPEDSVNLCYIYTPQISSTQNIKVVDMSQYIPENSFFSKEVKMFYVNEFGLLEDENKKKDVYSQSLKITHVFDEDEPLFYVYTLKHYYYSKEKMNPYEYKRINSILIVDGNREKIKDDKKYIMQLVETNEPYLYKVIVFTNFEKKPGEKYQIIYSATMIDENNQKKTIPGFIEDLNPQSIFKLKNDIDLNDFEYYLTPSLEYGYNRIFVSERAFSDKKHRKHIPFRWRLKAIKNGEILFHTPWIYDEILKPSSTNPQDKEYINGWKVLFNEMKPIDIVQLYGFEHEEGLRYEVESQHPDVFISTETKGDRAVKAIYNGEIDTGKIYFPPKYIAEKIYKEKEITYSFYLESKITNEKIELYPWVFVCKANDYKEHELYSYNLSPYYLRVPENINKDDWVLVIKSNEDTESWIRKENQIYLSCCYDNNEIKIEVKDIYENELELCVKYTKYEYVYKRGYAVYLQDENPIQLIKPIDDLQKEESWFIRIQNGKFHRKVYNKENNKEQIYLYAIPEYYRQTFDESKGLPIKQIKEEKPKIIGKNKIKVKYTPLHVELVENKSNIYVYMLIKPEDNLKPEEIIQNRIPLHVVSWDSSNGIIELEEGVKENDLIFVDYYYEEYNYLYRGFWDEEQQKFWYLDLNPSTGHLITYYDKENKEIREIPSYQLINQTIYFYIKPIGELKDREKIKSEELKWVGHAFDEKGMYQIYESKKEAIVNDNIRIYELNGELVDFEPLNLFYSNKFKVYKEINEVLLIDYEHEYELYQLAPETFKRESVFHTFEPIPEEEMEKENILLLGKVQVRPNTKIENVEIYDTRKRGGGLKEAIKEKMIKEICPESKFYWDIGYWDGEPYPENAVLVIKLPKYILKNHGGLFTVEDVHQHIQKHIAFGVFYIIDFIDESLEWIDTPVNLHADVVTLEEEDTLLKKPNFKLNVEEVDCDWQEE